MLMVMVVVVVVVVSFVVGMAVVPNFCYLRRPIFDLLPLSHIIKWLVLVFMFIFARIGISVFGLCAFGCGGDSYSRSGCD